VSRFGRSAVLHTVPAIALALMWAPDAAQACSVCIGTQSADTQIAYRAMTAFMTFTPMAIVGGVIYWIYRRFKALDAEEAAHAAALERAASGDWAG